MPTCSSLRYRQPSNSSGKQIFREPQFLSLRPEHPHSFGALASTPYHHTLGCVYCALMCPSFHCLWLLAGDLGCPLRCLGCFLGFATVLSSIPPIKSYIQRQVRDAAKCKLNLINIILPLPITSRAHEPDAYCLENLSLLCMVTSDARLCLAQTFLRPTLPCMP